jgi:hypothetical protein
VGQISTTTDRVPHAKRFAKFRELQDFSIRAVPQQILEAAMANEDEAKTPAQLTEAVAVLAQAFTELEQVVKAMGGRMQGHEEQITALTKLVDLNQALIQKLLGLENGPKAGLDVN